jgi:hypothetical protein
VEWAWVAGESAPEPRRITDRQRNKENELEKRPTGSRKSRMAKKREWQLKKKKNKYLTSKLQLSPNFRLDSVVDSNYRGKCDVGGFLIFE